MSLVESIFGNNVASGVKKEDNEKLTSLFGKPTAVPAKKTAVVVSETKSKSDDKKNNKKKEKAKEDSSSSDDDDSSSSSSSSDSSKNNKDDNQDKAEEERNTAPEETGKNNMNARAKDYTMKDEVTDEDKERRTVFVGNLPLSTTRPSLTKLFQQCGKVESARLRSVAVTGVKLPQEQAGNQKLVKKVCTNTGQIDVDAKASLQGYVVFANEESVEKALKLNNTPLSDDNPKATRAVRRIRVDYVNPTLDPKRSVFVGNLPYQAEEASLQDHFVQGCGLEITDVLGVRVIRDKDTFQCKGIGYVLFKDASMVATALQKMHETLYMKRPLRVKVCGKSIKGRRGAPKRKAEDADGNPSKKRQSFEGKRVMEDGAMKRIASKKKKRARGDKKNSKAKVGLKPGVSKRAASEAKVEKRVKQLKKRISKGMGKARK